MTPFNKVWRSSVLSALLLSLLLSQAHCKPDPDLDRRQVPTGPKNKDPMQNFVGDYEIGLLFDAMYGAPDAGRCFANSPSDQDTPAGVPEPVDTSLPCAAMRAYFANCSLGLSLAQLSQDERLDRFPENYQELPNDKQQACYCGDGGYWHYNAGCNACLQLHGYPLGSGGWIPDGYIAQQSSAYCSGKPTLNFREFLDAFTPTQTLSPPAATSYMPISDTATAASQTAVSAYFTAPSSTPTFLSATDDVTLSSYVETTTLTSATVSPTASSNNVNGRYSPPRWVMIGVGALAIL